MEQATILLTPHIRYDRLSQRWYFMAIGISNRPNKLYIAVSYSYGNLGTAHPQFLSCIGTTNLATVDASFMFNNCIFYNNMIT